MAEELEAVNPATGEVVGRFPRGGANEVDAAVGAAREALPAWRGLEPLARARLVGRIAAAVEDNAEELAQLDVLDNGSPIRDMRRDTEIAASQLRYFAGLALQVRGETIPGESGRLDYTLRQPYGVVGRIVPFNHPLMFAASRLGAPLIAGNTVVMKPSEHTSLSALRLGELIAEFMPPGVVNFVTGYGQEAGDALVAHPDVRRIAFIGSVPVGRTIQQRAASKAVSGTRPLEPPPLSTEPIVSGDGSGAVRGERLAHFGGRFVSTPVLDGAALRAGEVIEGPAIIQRMGDSVVIPEGFRAEVDRYLSLATAGAPE